MPYALESLTPDQFQQLCQALLVKEFPDVQCFPIGHADGGRDATSKMTHVLPRRSVRPFLLFQVKYHRTALSVSDPHKWLLSTLEEELPKIPAVTLRGASRYIILTNVPGTGVLNKGSIDKVDDVLARTLPIPAMCWWRDDVERRLDNSWDVKWHYIDILTGADLVRYFIENRLSDDKERRSNAIKSFLADQYESDSEVRFRQIELQNDLVKLFVDVPAAPLHHTQHEHHKVPMHVRAWQTIRRELRVHQGMPEGDPPHYLESEDTPVTAAHLILHRRYSGMVPVVVLEGAPGQGKSTVTQYVCQVHRMKLLGNPIVRTLPDVHQQAPLRLPFRVDLRDFATWLAKRDPFGAEPDTQPAGWNKSLESFLTALVRHHSGGAAFSVSDLQSVLVLSPTLIALDGLDEVADIPTRTAVVDEIKRGITRLAAVAAQLQVVIISRPAAYANSPGFPEERFPVLHLTSLPISIIEEYATKWVDARHLIGRERTEVLKILRNKIDQPHFRDLARNPMQLAILLGLIHSRGSSLPDKRTALYDQTRSVQGNDMPSSSLRMVRSEVGALGNWETTALGRRSRACGDPFGAWHAITRSTGSTLLPR
jgi:hypothetical protein